MSQQTETKLTQEQQIFIKWLERSVYSAKVRLGYAEANLRAAEQKVREAERDLKKWKKKYRASK